MTAANEFVPPTGTVVLLSADETGASGTASNLAAKSYNLAANTYSLIIIRAEVGLSTAVNAENNVRFEVKVGGVIKTSTRLWFPATGASDRFQVTGPLTWSESIQVATVISIGVTVVTGVGFWFIENLYVYGVLA